MLPNTLNTNEIKNAAGSEVEFEAIKVEGRTREFKQLVEAPNLPFRLSISHQENGDGVSKRRRSLLRFDKTVMGQVNTLETMKGSIYIVLDIPVGNMTSNVLSSDLLAALNSFNATTGAGTTVLFDGSGNGAVALANGSL